MNGKKGGLGLLVLGGVLIVIALVIKFVYVPGQAQFPDDVNTTRQYEGKLYTMLNPQALQSMDLANLFMNDLPINISRQVTTEEVDGGKAIVKEVAIMSAGGQTIQESETLYAINRKSMEAIKDFSDNKIIDREGLVIGWPIGSEKKDYTAWNGDTLETVTASFVREEERGGLNTYVYEASAPAQEIVAPEKLASFPPAIPKDLFLMLAQGIEIPETMQGAFALILPNLPDPVPLKYTYEYKGTYYVEPTTGVLIDTEKHEKRQVALSKEVLVGATQGVELPEDAAGLLALLPDPLPLTPVFEFDYQATAESVEDAAQDAKDAKSTLDLFGTTVPLALIVVGLILAVVGGFLFLRR